MSNQMRRIVQVMAFTLLVPLWPLGDANAQFNGALRGDYNLNFFRQCVGEAFQTAGAGPFNSGLSGQFALRGTVHYDGTGGGTLTGEQFIGGSSADQLGTGQGIPTGAGTEIILAQQNITCNSTTYSVGTTGRFTQRHTCTFTVLTGIAKDSTGTLDGLTIEGQLGLDGTVLVLENTNSTAATPNIEIQTFTSFIINGVSQTPPAPFRRICKGSGVATSRR